jgi:ribosomal protein S18 acetylase RimI-like enzyme
VAIDKGTHALIGLILCSRVKEDVGHITQVCLMPEFRGLGIGEALITTTCQALKNRNFSRLTLTVTEMNRQAVTLYTKLGFTTRRAFDAFVWGE